MSWFQGSSNFQIRNTNFNTIGGNATIVQFGDAQFTKIQRNLICDYIANLSVLPDINKNFKKHVLTQSILSLPRAKAVFNDYQNKKKSGPCFRGTREALLREMVDWATRPSKSRMYILSGLAGIGKSTVAYTIASRAANLNLLGTSFFFSRDEADRKNAEYFFTTIAYQLCVYNETFSKAIGDVLLTERGSAATTKDPQDQLQALILEPLRDIVRSHSRPILIVVDALDECNEEDTLSVLTGLSQLVRDLPLFKIILTTRPQPYLDRFLCSQSGHKIFRLHDIEDKVVDGDIRLYLNHSLSLEAVQERYPQRQWSASGEEIGSLVRAAGRLFIIASTAVRYIFDRSASNPAAQMQKLLCAFARYVTPFKDLDQFYTVILRNVVPENCDNNDTVRRYQSVVGAIVFVQRPLPVSTLAHLIKIDVVDIREVIDNLQSVILLDSDEVPHIYHKSFPDYLTDQARCKDLRLRIDTRIWHTQIVTHCFEIMDKHLKCNILGLGDPARFMSNEDGLKEDGLTKEQLEEKIPQQLRYACVYWANHLETTNMEDSDLLNRLERFVEERILHWFEVLSLIGKLDSSHHAIRAALKLRKSRSSDLHQLLSDALRFIGKFYELIKQSALHTYYSALPFTPSDSLLYRCYIKDTVNNLCSIEGGPERWDALVATMSHGEPVNIIKFSLTSTLVVSCSQERLKIWDAATGTPISTIPGHNGHFAVANDFSTVASFEDKTITCYNMNGSARGTMFTTSEIQSLALSSESSRVAAVLFDGTLRLWDIRNAKVIDSFDGGFGGYLGKLRFSPTGARFTHSSTNNTKLRDGISGRFIADLQTGSSDRLEFSGDGSRIGSLHRGKLALWDSESGGLIAAVEDGRVELWGTSPTMQRIGQDLRSKMKAVFFRIVRQSRRHTGPVKVLEFDPDGRLFASGAHDGTIKLWNGGDGGLRRTLKVPHWLQAVALSKSVLVAGWHNSVTLWSLDTLSLIHTFTEFGGAALKLSENSTLIAACDRNSHAALLDVVNRTTIATLDIPYNMNIHTMTFLPGNSQLVVLSNEGDFRSFDLINNRITVPTLKRLVQLPNTPLWHGVPIWHCHQISYSSEKQHYFAAWFSQHTNPVPVLWIPRQFRVRTWTQGSSMIALGCEDGRVILLRLATSQVS